jgi:hypothetical protein
MEFYLLSVEEALAQLQTGLGRLTFDNVFLDNIHYLQSQGTLRGCLNR